MFDCAGPLLLLGTSVALSRAAPPVGLRLLTAAASLAVGHGRQARVSAVAARGLGGCGAPARSPCGTCHLPGPGIGLVFPALKGGFLTTGPAEKPCGAFKNVLLCPVYFL